MAIQTINVGTTPNDGTGDTLRDAMIKVNSNFLQTESASLDKIVICNQANKDTTLGRCYR